MYRCYRPGKHDTLTQRWVVDGSTCRVCWAMKAQTSKHETLYQYRSNVGPGSAPGNITCSLGMHGKSNYDSLPIVSSPLSLSASGLLNLSKYKLNSGCKNLLAKGIKYIPAPRVTKRIEVEKAYSNFARRLELHVSFFFHKKKSKARDQKFRPMSTSIHLAWLTQCWSWSWTIWSVAWGL